MSAIAGIYSVNEPVPGNHGLQMMQVLKKFPADDVQIWSKENIFLGCHAQWITPESIEEQLPFYDYDRQLAITADAIIDNRDELFDKLGIHPEERKLMPDKIGRASCREREEREEERGCGKKTKERKVDWTAE